MILIGESIHTVSGVIKKAIHTRNPEPIRVLAVAQAKAGADYLDLNLCSIMTGAEEAMRWVVETVQAAVEIPVVIDIPNFKAMEAGLKACQRKAVINGINGMAESKEKMFPLASEYKTDVILGLYNEQGVPGTAEERSLLAMELIDYAGEAGIRTENIWIDPAVYPVCTNQQQVVACLEFLKMIDDVLPGAKTITGISNVSSCGVPAELRGILNRTFFVMARRYNQHAAIVNVLDQELVLLNSNELPHISGLIHRAMDDEEIDVKSLSQQEMVYMKATHFLLGKEPYSHEALKI